MAGLSSFFAPADLPADVPVVDAPARVDADPVVRALAEVFPPAVVGVPDAGRAAVTTPAAGALWPWAVAADAEPGPDAASRTERNTWPKFSPLDDDGAAVGVLTAIGSTDGAIAEATGNVHSPERVFSRETFFCSLFKQ